MRSIGTLLALLALLVVGCGGDSEDGSSAGNTPTVGSTTVSSPVATSSDGGATPDSSPDEGTACSKQDIADIGELTLEPSQTILEVATKITTGSLSSLPQDAEEISTISESLSERRDWPACADEVRAHLQAAVEATGEAIKAALESKVDVAQDKVAEAADELQSLQESMQKLIEKATD